MFELKVVVRLLYILFKYFKWFFFERYVSRKLIFVFTYKPIQVVLFVL